MSWQLLLRAMRMAFLLRVSWITLFALALFGPASRSSPLLSNLLDMSDYPAGTILISISAFLLAYTAVATANLTLTYGADRFPDGHAFPHGQKRPLWIFWAGTLAAASLLACVVLRTESDTKALQTLYAILGFAVSLLLVLVSKIAQLTATDPKTTPHPPPYLIFPAYKIPALERFLDRFYCNTAKAAPAVKAAINRISQWPLEILHRAGQGYFIDMNARRGNLKLRSGHVFALTLSSITFVFYVATGFGKRFITAEQADIPALAFALLFFTVCCWAWSALTFFLDRYRFPLLWTMVALSAITATAPESDHFFRVPTDHERTAHLLTPARYLRARIDDAKKKKHPARLIFVATPGGGIQAAAWTAKVLDNLDEKLGIPKGFPNFRDSVCFISSVSGGSLGSLAYTAKLERLIDEKSDSSDDPTQAASSSAIDEVAWGWTQPDFWRTILPWLGNREVDRGWALEEKWIDVNRLGPKRKGLWQTIRTGPPQGRDRYLDDWAARGAELPALVFNSMLVEPGKHVVFSTTAYPGSEDKRGVVNFYSLYPGKKFDLRVATAARLSASFPYVAPAARPSLDPYAPAFHFVDGGYYDNYGIDSLIGWLSDALDDPKDPEVNREIGDILVLEIRHFNSQLDNTGTAQGWAYQLYAPIYGLLAMWNAAPISRDRNELNLYADKFKRIEGKIREVRHATIPFASKSGECAPLSWKLSRNQQRCIEEAWAAIPQWSAATKDNNIKKIHDFLTQEDPK